MHYLIYKITNNINGKIYIGKHMTENIDDDYMGSGVAIRNAEKKYGVENFTKEILFDVYGEDLMNFLEEAIVDEAFVARKDTYNLRIGGKGGALSDEHKRKISEAHLGKEFSEEHRKHISEFAKTRTGEKNPNYGRHRKHTEEEKQKISEAGRGRCFWHNGIEQKYCRECPGEGFIKGVLKNPSEETRKKLGDVSRGKHFWNNGVQQIRCKECPGEGWIRGKLKKLSEEHKKKIGESLKSSHWWHNDNEETKAFECPEGWIKGRLNRK